MLNIKSITENFKILALFAIIGFVFSFLIGLISSVGFISVIIRSFLMAAMFFVVSFVILLVLKMFVPEVYAVITQNGMQDASSSEGVDIGSDNTDQFTDMPDTGIPGDESTTGDEFQEVSPDNLSSLKPEGSPRSGDSQLNTTLSAAEDGKLGKHIIVNENNVEYEPKLMAQAVRTMLSKDEQ